MLETKNSTVEGCGIEILEPRAVNSHGDKLSSERWEWVRKDGSATEGPTEVKTIILGSYNTFKFNFKRLQRSVQNITNMPN